MKALKSKLLVISLTLILINSCGCCGEVAIPIKKTGNYEKSSLVSINSNSIVTVYKNSLDEKLFISSNISNVLYPIDYIEKQNLVNKDLFDRSIVFQENKIQPLIDLIIELQHNDMKIGELEAPARWSLAIA